MKKLNRKERRCALKIGVSIYWVNRAYGGPEEGGWWYDYGTPVPGTTETFFNPQKARARWNELEEACDRINDEGRPHTVLGSVLCTGALRAVRELPGMMPAPFPSERPRYE